ncbi:MAG: tripartite tricarboxylate transporter substrate-binding protein [Vicinamibacteria bacterium]
MRPAFPVLASLFAATAFSQEATRDRILIMAPAAPGGGWDQTARSIAAALQKETLVRVVEVENVSGAAGTIGLARFASAYRGRDDALLVTGLVMMSAIVMNDSPLSLAEVTPVARLTGEYEVLVVPGASPLRSLADLTRALRAHPGAVSFAGGSAGGTDHLLVGLLAKEVGVDLARTNYVAFSGGGESLGALLGNQVAAGVSGLSEYGPHIESGSLRALAISSAEPIPGADIPTFREQGVDLALANWRGVVAPPGISAAKRDALADTIDRLVRSPSWQEALNRNSWVDLYLPPDRFSEFLGTEQRRVSAVVRDLEGPETRPPDVEGMVFPAIVAVGLLVASGLLLAHPSGNAGEARPKANARALGLVSLGAILDLALMQLAGFIVASTVLFWCVARGFGSRRSARDAVVGFALSTAAYFLFTRLLSLSLPSGRLFP